MITVATIFVVVGVIGLVAGIIGIRRRTLPLLDELKREQEERRR